MSNANLRWATMALILVSLFIYIYVLLGLLPGVGIGKIKADKTPDKDMNRGMQAVSLLGFTMLSIAAIFAICLRHTERDGWCDMFGYMTISITLFVAVACGIATVAMVGSVTDDEDDNNVGLKSEVYVYHYSVMTMAVIFALVAMFTSMMLACPNICSFPRYPRDPRDAPYKPPVGPGSFPRRGPTYGPGPYGSYP